MFKKKGSSTLVAVVCSLICAALGVFYGLKLNSSTPAVAPAVAEEKTGQPAMGSTAVAIDRNPPVMSSPALHKLLAHPAVHVRTGVGVTRFARPAGGTAAGTTMGVESYSSKVTTGTATF